MVAGLDFDILKQKPTWQAFGVAIVLFCIIGYSSLTLFDLSAGAYGTTDEIEPATDFEVLTMQRDGIDDTIPLRDGYIRLSDLRGSVVVLDFMAVDCSNCHYVQQHIDQNLDEWRTIGGDYPVVAISIASWYGYESFEQINSTFGEQSSNRHMP